jgi:hypothetical protein
MAVQRIDADAKNFGPLGGKFLGQLAEAKDLGWTDKGKIGRVKK